MGLKDRAREKKAATREKGQALKARATELGMDLVQRFFVEFNASLPLLEAAGYRLIDVEIVLGVPPKFAPCFERTRVVSEAEQAQRLEGLGEKGRARSMLEQLYKTSALQDLLDPGGLQPAGIVMELGVPPETRIRYQRPAGGGEAPAG